MAALNVNGMAAQPQITMLEDFLKKKQEIDIILLQEITKPVFDDIRGFVAHTNIGTTGRGTAILSRDQLHFTNIRVVRLPTAEYQKIECLRGRQLGHLV